MTRIAELQKKYPGVPRAIVTRLDALRHGVRDTDDLDKVSQWGPALHSYQSYDYDISLIDMARERPHRFKPGFVLRPDQFFTKDGIATSIIPRKAPLGLPRTPGSTS